MGHVDKHAKRILGGIRKGTVDERVFSGYMSFDGGIRPIWWNDGIAHECWGRVLGVHENESGVRVGAIVITEMGLGVLGERSVVAWLPYVSIAGWDPLSKEPVSRSLRVQKDTGEQVELLFGRGGAFAFVQFISCAMREHRRT